MTHQSITPVTERAHLTKAHLYHRRKSKRLCYRLICCTLETLKKNTFQLYLGVFVLVCTPLQLSVLSVSGRKVLFISEILCLMMQAGPKSGKKDSFQPRDIQSSLYKIKLQDSETRKNNVFHFVCFSFCLTCDFISRFTV